MITILSAFVLFAFFLNQQIVQLYQCAEFLFISQCKLQLIENSWMFFKKNKNVFFFLLQHMRTVKKRKHKFIRETLIIIELQLYETQYVFLKQNHSSLLYCCCTTCSISVFLHPLTRTATLLPLFQAPFEYVPGFLSGSKGDLPRQLQGIKN